MSHLHNSARGAEEPLFWVTFGGGGGRPVPAQKEQSGAVGTCIGWQNVNTEFYTFDISWKFVQFGLVRLYIK